MKTNNLSELKKIIKDKKIAFVPWCEKIGCEESLKHKTGGAKSLNIPFNQKKVNEKCVGCSNSAKSYVYFGKSY